jgi:hypothetical protein
MLHIVNGWAYCASSSVNGVLVLEWLERVVAAMGFAFLYDPLSSFGVSVNLMRSGKGVLSMSELFFSTK